MVRIGKVNVQCGVRPQYSGTDRPGGLDRIERERLVGPFGRDAKRAGLGGHQLGGHAGDFFDLTRAALGEGEVADTEHLGQCGPEPVDLGSQVAVRLQQHQSLAKTDLEVRKFAQPTAGVVPELTLEQGPVIALERNFVGMDDD